jgi:DNA-binding CsgD family transcriptional regulator
MSATAVRKTFSTAVRLAVASSSTQELVESALRFIADGLGAASVILYRQFDARIESWVPRGMPHPMDDYVARVQHCPLQPLKRRLNPRLAIISDLIDGRTYRMSEMFNEVFRPYGLERQMIARLNDVSFGDAGVCGLVICRSEGDVEWTRDHERELGHALPLLSASVERNARWERLRNERDILATALGKADGSPMLLFNHEGRLVWMSEKATTLLSTHLGRHAALDEPFRSAVHGLLALQTSPDLPRTITLEVAAGRNGSSLRAGLFSARTRDTEELFIVVALEEKCVAPEVLALGEGRFGLTRSEVAVVRELATGAGTRVIGSRLFISHETVRTHLKRIYEKMDVHSRVELLAKLRAVRTYY